MSEEAWGGLLRVLFGLGGLGVCVFELMWVETLRSPRGRYLVGLSMVCALILTVQGVVQLIG